MKKIIAILVLLLVIVGGTCIYLAFFRDYKAIYADTPVEVRQIKPVGKLYVMGTVMEDYVLDTMQEKSFLRQSINAVAGLIGKQVPYKKHYRMMCLSYTAKYYVNLSQLRVTFSEDGKKATIHQPGIQAEYGKLPGKDRDYVCDDEDFWDKEFPDRGASLANIVRKKIEQKFDTPQNRHLAQQKAIDDIQNIYQSLGFEVEFVK